MSAVPYTSGFLFRIVVFFIWNPNANFAFSILICIIGVAVNQHRAGFGHDLPTAKSVCKKMFCKLFSFSTELFDIMAQIPELFKSEGINDISQISFPHLIPPILCIRKSSITAFNSKMAPIILLSTMIKADNHHKTKYI